MANQIDLTRKAAASLLGAVLEDGRLIADLTGEAGPLKALSAPDRARAQRLAIEALRHMGRADALLKPLLRRPPPLPVAVLLRLGVVEMLQAGAPAHGVVSALVGVARADKRTATAAGLVNAVLRKVPERAADWDGQPPQKMPGWLRGRLDSAWGRAAVVAMEAAHAQGAALDLTPKSGDAAGLATRLGGRELPTGSVRVEEAGQVSALPGFDTGDWWVQDAAAALPARLLDVQPGETVLDLCAAPGGKTMQLAAAGADVTAVDASETRLERLHENLARTGLTARVIAADLLDWAPPGPVDAILLDAPCSATGTIRRHPDLPFTRTGKDVKPLFALQANLLDRALDWLKPGGRLVYCTCSILPEEGEAQLAGALERHKDLTPLPLQADWIDPAWRAEGGGLRLRPDLWPEQGGLDGFFICALRKSV